MSLKIKISFKKYIYLYKKIESSNKKKKERHTEFKVVLNL
jgi:hypothetical protein